MIEPYYKAKGPDSYCTNPAPSNLVVVERLAALTRHTHHITRCCVHVKAITQDTRSQRCFSQFDRKTDCLRNGSEARKSGCSSRQKGSFRVPARIDLPPGANQKVGVASDETDLAGSYAQSLPFTQAVCGTQTRHGGSVNKNQPDSQNYGLRSELAQCSGNKRVVVIQALQRLPIHQRTENGLAGSSPAANHFWQKSGIGVAASSPVPLRESDEEKETSTRSYGSDEGKATAMSKLW
jgi:hypothetical protein